jgi:hypothetical protein
MGMYVEENGPGVIKVGLYGWIGSLAKWWLIRRRQKDIYKAALTIRRKFRVISHANDTFWVQIEFCDDYEEYLASKTNVAFSFDEVLEILKREFTEKPM